MPTILNRHLFEPNQDARKTWLATRKNPGPFELPGFYTTIDYEKDTTWVMLAACVEAAAVALTLYGGVTKGGVFLFGSIITVVLFLVFDIVGANLYHQNAGIRCLLTNQARVNFFEGANATMKKGLFVEVVGLILIVLSAVFKIAAILLLGKFNIIFYAIMALLYLIVIYIHIAHTGYFFAERKTSSMFRKQHEQWSEDRIKLKNKLIQPSEVRYSVQLASETTFDSVIPLNLENGKITYGEHYIAFVGEKGDSASNKIYTYKIKALGTLIDEDIRFLTRGQERAAGFIIAEACLRHQLMYH